METEIEKVKIRTKKGRIITLSITSKTEEQMIGIDKFGDETIISYKDISQMYRIKNDE